MEFWEGALLVVGGVWLIGHMSRRSHHHPVNSVSAYINQVPEQNLTNMTNEAGGGTSLTYGEPLLPAQPPLLSGRSVAAGAMVKRTPTSLATRPAVIASAAPATRSIPNLSTYSGAPPSGGSIRSGGRYMLL